MQSNHDVWLSLNRDVRKDDLSEFQNNLLLLKSDAIAIYAIPLIVKAGQHDSLKCLAYFLGNVHFSCRLHDIQDNQFTIFGLKSLELVLASHPDMFDFLINILKMRKNDNDDDNYHEMMKRLKDGWLRKIRGLAPGWEYALHSLKVLVEKEFNNKCTDFVDCVAFVESHFERLLACGPLTVGNFNAIQLLEKIEGSPCWARISKKHLAYTEVKSGIAAAFDSEFNMKPFGNEHALSQLYNRLYSIAMSDGLPEMFCYLGIIKSSPVGVRFPYLFAGPSCWYYLYFAALLGVEKAEEILFSPREDRCFEQRFFVALLLGRENDLISLASEKDKFIKLTDEVLANKHGKKAITMQFKLLSICFKSSEYITLGLQRMFYTVLRKSLLLAIDEAEMIAALVSFRQIGGDDLCADKIHKFLQDQEVPETVRQKVLAIQSLPKIALPLSAEVIEAINQHAFKHLNLLLHYPEDKLIALLNWIAGYPYPNNTESHHKENEMRGLLFSFGQSSLLELKLNPSLMHIDTVDDDLRMQAIAEYNAILLRESRRIANTLVIRPPSDLQPASNDKKQGLALLANRSRFVGSEKWVAEAQSSNAVSSQDDLMDKFKATKVRRRVRKK